MELTISQLKGMIEIFTELKTEKILTKSVQKVSEILKAKGCSIFLYDSGKDCISLAETTAYVSPENEHISYSRREGLTGWVFEFKKPLLIQNLDQKTDNDLKAIYGKEINWKSKFVEGKSPVAKSFVAVPIISQSNKFYGVIRSSRTKNNFTKKHLNLLLHVAHYISIALENSSIYLQEHKKADYFKLLTEFGTKLHTHFTLEDLLVFVAEQAALTFSAETCEIYLRDQNDQHNLILRAGYGIPKELINKASHFIGEGLTGTLVAENRTIRLSNVLTFPRYKGKYRKRMKENLKYGDRLAFLGIPISVKSDVIGCIKLYNKIPKYTRGATHFTDDDEKYLGILGYILSVAIENLQYLDSMQNSALQMIKTQRLTALGTMAIRLPNEMTNSLTTAQLAIKNLLRKLNKNDECNPDYLKKKLMVIDNSLADAAKGVKTLHDFSTKAGFMKLKKTWQEVIDESLLFLSDEVIHKKINVIRDHEKETLVPDLMVEPNEMIEVMINLLLLAIFPLEHYRSVIMIDTVFCSETLSLRTKISSIDNKREAKIESGQTIRSIDSDIVTPQQFMFNVSREIIASNYKGKITLDQHARGVDITIAIPIGGENV
jgi:signal transduction protein with GAF and PtsI domain